MQFQQNQKISITSGTVTVGSITGTVNVAGTVAISGGSVTISGTPNVNVTGGSITISSGSVSISAGTITTIVNPVTVLNDVNTLINVSYQFNLGNYSNTFTAGSAAAGLRLVLLPSLLNLDIGGTIGIFINNNTNNSIYQSTGIIGKFPPYGAGGSSGFQVDIPIAVDSGDQLTVTLTDNQGGLGIGNATKIILLGLSNPPQITTSPGQPVNVYQLGGLSKVSATIAAAGTQAIIGAPPTGTAYAIKRVAFGGIAAATTQIKVIGHTSNVRVAGLQLYTQAGTMFIGEDCGGVLMTEALDLVTLGGGTTVDIHYDVVAVPVPQ